MPPFDVSARISVENAFTQPLNKLEKDAKSAEDALKKLGTATNFSQGGAATPPNMGSLMSQIDQMKAQAAQLQNSYKEMLPKPEGPNAFVSSLTQVQSGMSGVIGIVGKFIPVLAGAFTIAGIKNLVMDLTELGLVADQASARFVAFSGGAISAARNMELMDAAVGNAMSRMDKMSMISRIMSLDLADSAEEAANIAEMALVLGAAGASATDRISNFTRMLSTGVVRGLASYGINVQEAKKRANELMIANNGMTKQEATSAAVLEFSAKKMQQVEQAGGKAATATREYGSAWADLRLALAEKISPVIEPVIRGAVNLVSGGAKAVEEIGKTGAIDAAVKAREDLEQADAALAAAEAKWQEGLADPNAPLLTYKMMLDKARDDKEAALILYQIAKAALGSAEDFASLAANTQKLNQELKESESALAYQKAINELVDKSSGINALSASLGTLSQTMTDMSKGTPEMPKIGANVLAVDTVAIREYISAVRLVDPVLAALAAKTLVTVDSLDAQQRAIINTATSMSDHNAALQLLAAKTLGAGASILDLINKFDSLPSAVQSAINGIGGFTAALTALEEKANMNVSVGVVVSGMASALSEVDSLALSVAGIVSPAQLDQFRGQMRSDLENYYANVGAVDKFEMDAGKARHLDYWKGIVDNTKDALKDQEKAVKDHNAEMKKLETETSGRIKSVLAEGLKVTPTQAMATALGTYADQGLESARRLQAIAERGRAELKRHPDWAGFLKIPEDILNGSDLALKAWAAQTKEDVADLSRPDLINWDAFIGDYKKQLDKETAQGLTMDIALGKIKEAGLLGGSEEEARKRIAQKLGIGEPSITFDSEFKVNEGAGGQIITDVLAGKPALEVPVELKVLNSTILDRLDKLNNPPPIPEPPTTSLTPTGTAFKQPPLPEPTVTPAERAEYDRKRRQLLEGGSEIPQPPPPVKALTPTTFGLINTVPPVPPTPLPVPPKAPVLGYPDIDITKMPDKSAEFGTQGRKWLEWTVKGWDQGMPDIDLGSSFIHGLDSAGVESRDQFENAGKQFGHLVGGAFSKAVIEDVKGARNDIAWVIAPAVAEILKSGNKGREMP